MVFLGSLGYTYVTPRTNTSKKSISSGNNGGFAERREEGNAGNGNENVNENENGRVGGDGIDEDVVEEDGEGDVREVKKRQ